MQIEDASNIDLYLLLSYEAGVHRYKVGRLREAINNPHIESTLWAVVGKTTMKSMVMSCHF
jgi:hypothetical protein